MKWINSFLTTICILFGAFFGFYLLNGYDKKEKIALANLNKEELYFLKYKEYTTIEELENDKTLNDYIYTNQNGKYQVYLAITQNEKNLQKIKEFFEKKGYVISEEKIMISNETFIEILKQYDTLLENTNKEDVIEAIICQVLAKYEENVIED